MENFDFSVVQREEQEVGANGVEATASQVDATVAFFGWKKTNLIFSAVDEVPETIETPNELYS